MFDRLNITFYGGSHEKIMGAVVGGIPIGSKFSREHIEDILKRRAPISNISTTRKEKDEVNFVKGIKEDKGLIEVIDNEMEFYIENSQFNDSEYENLIGIVRPSHADYSAYKKNGSIPIGGGKYSGRMTALLCVIGSMAKDILTNEGIEVNSSVKEIGKVEKDDSAGGIILTTISGVKAGQLGDALFDGLDGKIAYSIFGVPAVKGIEFGKGFELATMRGSESNDSLYIDDTKSVKYKTNNMGGVDGGISNGNDINFSVVIKPTPSISKEQDTINIEKMENISISINGRHDACIVPRAVPCIESAAAIAVLDELLKSHNWCFINLFLEFKLFIGELWKI